MKRVITIFVLLFLCTIGYTQLTLSATGASTTQNSSGDFGWIVEASSASVTVDNDESRLFSLVALLASSHTLLVTDFSFSSFPASEGVGSAQLRLRNENFNLASISPSFTVRVIRIDGGETTILSASRASLVQVLGINLINFNIPGEWTLDGLTGADLNNSTFRVEVEVDIPLSVGFNLGVDEVELEFSTEAPLPVEWGDFSVNASKEGAHLKWATETESNNAFFSIEKSPNGKEWRTFDEVKGVGTSFERKEYEIIDKSPFSPLSYYRIKQLDYDGTYSYSKIVSVRERLLWDSAPAVVNPAIGHFALKYPQGTMETDLEVILLDPAGREVHRQMVNQGNNTFSANTIPSGSYFMAIRNTSTQQRWTTKVIYFQK